MTTKKVSTQNRGKIVVGLDGSEPSKAALLWALDLARALKKTVEAITVWEYPMMSSWEAGVFFQWTPEEDAKKVVRSTFSNLFGDQIPQEISTSVREGNAAAVLIDASKNAEILVVGSRGRGGFTGLLLGSVSSACAERCKCPVLVVHGRKSA